jgi:hypothetical protein
MLIAPIWHASWWEHYELMLAGFLVALVGLAREYTRSDDAHDDALVI